MDSKLVEMHSKRVTQGERSRILWECFMEQLGLSYEATPKDVFERMAVVQKEYEESVHFFGEIMKQAHKTEPQEFINSDGMIDIGTPYYGDSQANEEHPAGGNTPRGKKAPKNGNVSVNHK